ncbi:MAG: hypothetical protein HY238_00535 [Acidobacteria bacterium]|nr:hypothetical protein [Acidobacteriota bacterium]
MWEIPEIRRWGRIGRHVLSGWQLNGITRFDSGSPFNIVSGRDTNLDGSSNDRPNLTGNPRLSEDRPRDERIAGYFNTAVFVAAPDGFAGNAGRNLLYGPGSMSWTVSFFKTLRLRERRRLQFRSEFFNFFNQVNLNNPNSTLNSANFGRILSAGQARVIQFGLKYGF